MSSYSIKKRTYESTNIWPGFVDILATLLIVIIFILMVFTVSQFYLSDAVVGRDKALDDLRKQLDALSAVLLIESTQKQEALTDLEATRQKLETETLEKKGLQKEIKEKSGEVTAQSLKITTLGEQIQDLLEELKVVANALEIYEGQEITALETKGLGERINRALAMRIDQLNTLNEELVMSKKEISKQNEELVMSKKEISKQLNIVEILNLELSQKEQALQDQVEQYQKLTKDLIAINEGLGLEDASLTEQLEAIKQKNQELFQLNQNLIVKENIIIDLRSKILGLNNILSIDEEKRVEQQQTISELGQKIQTLQVEKKELETSASTGIIEAEQKAESALIQVGILSDEIDILSKEIAILNTALDASERELLTKELKIDVLGERLNKALTSQVLELQEYRSEFFGRLKQILGDREDIKVVGDRFIFESELLFDSGSATLREEGKSKMLQIAQTLKVITEEIPSDVKWIVQVEGHTDNRPINTYLYPSNWELSTARANSVLKLLLDVGFNPKQLAAAGYGESYPIAEGETEKDLRRNRRIELKLTSR